MSDDAKGFILADLPGTGRATRLPVRPCNYKNTALLMPRASLAPHFHASALIRCLARLGNDDVALPAEQFATRLADFFDFSEAVVLSSAHSIATSGAVDPDLSGFAIVAEYQQGRARIEQAVARSFTPDPGPARAACPSVRLGPGVEVARAYEPFHRFYLVQQRDMDFAVRQLHAGIRQSLSSLTVRLRRLAALDKAFEDILAERSRHLLSKVPVLAARRFADLCGRASGQAASPATDPHLLRFRQDLQALLLAELDIRLQPLAGLVDAYQEEVRCVDA